MQINKYDLWDDLELRAGGGKVFVIRNITSIFPFCCSNQRLFHFIPKRKALNVAFNLGCGEGTENTPSLLSVLNELGHKHSFLASLWSNILQLCFFFVLFVFLTPTLSVGPRSSLWCSINLNSMHICHTICDWCSFCHLMLALDGGSLWLMEPEGCKALITKKRKKKLSIETSSYIYISFHINIIYAVSWIKILQNQKYMQFAFVCTF